MKISFRYLGLLLLPTACTPTLAASSQYHLATTYPIAGEGNWDYLSVDSASHRLYVSHGMRLDVLDTQTGKVVGQIPDTPGVHGAAIASDLQRGFTSNGGDSSVTVFDTKTLKTLRNVKVSGTDFILYDPFTQRVFPLHETVTVLDARSADPVGELNLGGDPEAGVSDENGRLYVNLQDKDAIAVVDARTLQVTRTYPLERCSAPHSLSFDGQRQRLFVGCRDAFVAVDAASGRIVGRTIICGGVDASGYDPQTGLIFESCIEGVISVIRQVSPDFYDLVDTVKTQLYAKTMTIDATTRKLYLPTADFDLVANSNPKAPSAYQRKQKAGSFRVLVVQP
jgi:hypothetical protein